MESSLEKPKAESLPSITDNETMEHTESIEETSITDGAQILNAAQASNEGELNPMIFGTREFHAGITAAGVSMHDLQSIHNRVWNSIAHKPKSQQEAEVQITLLTLKNLIHHHNLDSSLLHLLESSTNSPQDAGQHLSLPLSVPRIDRGEELPLEVLGKIAMELFSSGEKTELQEVVKGVFISRPKDHAFLLAGRLLNFVGMQHYHEHSDMWINTQIHDIPGPIQWGGRTMMVSIIVIDNLDAAKGLYYVLDQFPKLKYVQLDLLPRPLYEDELGMEVTSQVSLHALRSKPMELLKSDDDECDECGHVDAMSKKFKEVYDVCAQLKSRGPTVEAKFQIHCTDVKCLKHRDLPHELFIKYNMTLSKLESLNMIDKPRWDFFVGFLRTTFGFGEDEDDLLPDCECEAKFDDPDSDLTSETSDD